MPKLAIIDQTVSAGGVERFLHGLIGGAIAERITDDWEIVLIRARFNSANIQVSLPHHLLAPNLRVEYLGADNRLSRALSRFRVSGRAFGVPGSGRLKQAFVNAVRGIGTVRWKAYCGDARSWIEHYLNQNRFDVAYFSYPYFLDPPRPNMPVVATPHDFIFKHGLSTTPEAQRLLDSQLPKWFEACSTIVVSSQFVASELERFYPGWTKKTRIIRLGIPAAPRTPTRDEVEGFRKHYGLPERFVLVVGWIVEHKNQQVVFEAVAKLRDRGLHIPVVCIGPNSDALNEPSDAENPGQRSRGYVAQILKFCKSAGLRNGTDYFSLGFVDDISVECLYRSAMMLIVPTLTEAGSFPAREAMRAGCPVAYAQVPVYEEEMQSIKGNAWTFPPHDGGTLADVIAEVANNGEEARRRAAAAKEIVPQVYCWRKAARGYFSVFEHAAGLRSTAQDDRSADAVHEASGKLRPTLIQVSTELKPNAGGSK